MLFSEMLEYLRLIYESITELWTAIYIYPRYYATKITNYLFQLENVLPHNEDYIRQKDQVYIWRLLTCSQSLGLFFYLTLTLGWILIWSNYQDKVTSLFKMNAYVFYQISKLQLSDTYVHSFFSPLILVFISK